MREIYRDCSGTPGNKLATYSSACSVRYQTNKKTKRMRLSTCVRVWNCEQDREAMIEKEWKTTCENVEKFIGEKGGYWSSFLSVGQRGGGLCYGI